MYLASVKRLSISRPLHLSSMFLNEEEEEEDDLFGRLWVLLTSITYYFSGNIVVSQITSQVPHPHHMVSLKG